MIGILAVIQIIKSQYIDTGRTNKSSVLEDWRHVKWGFLVVNAQTYAFWGLNCEELDAAFYLVTKTK